uniref:BTB domain-containing protein n=1 Tax=Panagrolaimus davidi TaxID=227884 RepID=A0A914PVV9_9BILA
MSVVNQLSMPSARMDSKSRKPIFQRLYDSKEYDDLTFIVSRKEVFANETIVKMRSSVLKARIENPERIPNGRILLDDQNLDDFKQFLKFLYLNDCEITSRNFVGLIRIRNSKVSGKKYDVPSLSKKCMTFFEANIGKWSVQSFVEETVKHPALIEFFQKCLSLGPSAIEFISFSKVDMFGIIWYICPINFVQHILKFDRSVDAEEVLFEKVYDWAKAYCFRASGRGVTVSIKEAMKDLIPYIHFENLKKYTLATVVRSNNLLSTDELLKLFVKFVTDKMDGKNEIMYESDDEVTANESENENDVSEAEKEVAIDKSVKDVVTKESDTKNDISESDEKVDINESVKKVAINESEKEGDISVLDGKNGFYESNEKVDVVKSDKDVYTDELVKEAAMNVSDDELDESEKDVDNKEPNDESVTIKCEKEFDTSESDEKISLIDADEIGIV